MSETPLYCFPMRMEWEATLPLLTAEPFPAPLRTSHHPWPESLDTPGSVLSLMQSAAEYSWEVRTQYSQGYMPHATHGRPGALKDLIGLRFGAHPMTDRQAYAVYSRNASGGTWTWASIMIWGPDLPPFAGCSVTQLQTYLEIAPGMPTGEALAFVSVIQEIRACKAAEKKAKPKAPPKPKEDHA